MRENKEAEKADKKRKNENKTRKTEEEIKTTSKNVRKRTKRTKIIWTQREGKKTRRKKKLGTITRMMTWNVKLAAAVTAKTTSGNNKTVESKRNCFNFSSNMLAGYNYT